MKRLIIISISTSLIVSSTTIAGVGHGANFVRPEEWVEVEWVKPPSTPLSPNTRSDQVITVDTTREKTTGRPSATDSKKDKDLKKIGFDDSKEKQKTPFGITLNSDKGPENRLGVAETDPNSKRIDSVDLGSKPGEGPRIESPMFQAEGGQPQPFTMDIAQQLDDPKSNLSGYLFGPPTNKKYAVGNSRPASAGG